MTFSLLFPLYNQRELAELTDPIKRESVDLVDAIKRENGEYGDPIKRGRPLPELAQVSTKKGSWAKLG
jgi:hypothetical protein